MIWSGSNLCHLLSKQLQSFQVGSYQPSWLLSSPFSTLNPKNSTSFTNRSGHITLLFNLFNYSSLSTARWLNTKTYPLVLRGQYALARASAPDARASPGQWLYPAFSSWVLVSPSCQLLREASWPPCTAQSPPSLALMDPVPSPCGIYTSVCFFDINTLGVFFPSPAFSKVNKKSCLCLNCAYCVNQPQNSKPLVADKMAWWGERGGTILGSCPSFTTTSLQVRLSGGSQGADSSSFRSAAGPPATRPPYAEADTDEADGDTDALHGGCELLRESCQLRFSQLQQAIIFLHDQIQSDYQRSLALFFQRLCFPSFLFCFTLHKVREPSGGNL